MIIQALITCLFGTCILPVAPERLFGWQGESFDRDKVFGDQQHISLSINRDKIPTKLNTRKISLQNLVHENETKFDTEDVNIFKSTINSTLQSGLQREGWIETLSQKPRAYLYHNFLSEWEAKHLIQLAFWRLKRSEVGGKVSEISKVRTSYGMFIKRYQDDIVTAIESRVANWTHLPVENQEDLQILRYGFGQEYKEHFDANGRVATVLLYLNDVDEGGETVFPMTEMNDLDYVKRNGPFSECAQGHVAAKPKLGDALLFFSQMPGSTGHDTASKHRGCPIIRGIKYTGTIWIHGEPYRPETLDGQPKDLRDPGLCYDSNQKCQEWAESGECDNNPDYMMQNCILSCLKCTPCSVFDFECRRSVRERLGYLTNDDDLAKLGISMI